MTVSRLRLVERDGAAAAKPARATVNSWVAVKCMILLCSFSGSIENPGEKIKGVCDLETGL